MGTISRLPRGDLGIATMEHGEISVGWTIRFFWYRGALRVATSTVSPNMGMDICSTPAHMEVSWGQKKRCWTFCGGVDFVLLKHGTWALLTPGILVEVQAMDRSGCYSHDKRAYIKRGCGGFAFWKLGDEAKVVYVESVSLGNTSICVAFEFRGQVTVVDGDLICRSMLRNENSYTSSDHTPKD